MSIQPSRFYALRPQIISLNYNIMKTKMSFASYLRPKALNIPAPPFKFTNQTFYPNDSALQQ